MVFFTFPEDARWNADRREVEFGLAVGKYQGIVRVPRRVFQHLLSVADEMSGFGSRRSVRFLGEFQTGGSGCGPRYGWRGIWRHWSDIEAGG